MFSCFLYAWNGLFRSRWCRKEQESHKRLRFRENIRLTHQETMLNYKERSCMRSHRLHRQRTPKEPTANIVVDLNRSQTMIWIALGAGSCALFFLFFIFLLIIMNIIPGALNVGSVFCAILCCGFVIMGTEPSCTLAKLWRSKEPFLVINHDGIRIGKIYGSCDIALAWSEIDAIYMAGNDLNKQLYIRPTNVKHFLSQFHLTMRFFLHVNLMSGAPIAIAQSFLETPIEAILEQLQELYAHELLTHHIQFER